MKDPLPEKVLQALTEALLHDRKIAAIKLYRKSTGLDLKQSKQHVEELAASLRHQFPEKFAAPQKKGCFAGATTICLAALAVTCLLLRG